MSVVLLIDGDLLLYRTLAATEVEVNWEGDIWSLWANLADAKVALERQVKNLEETLGASQSLFCLSDWTQPRFRKLIEPTYKKGRGRKPCGYAAFREWSVERFTARWKPGLEADDVMGILATQPNPAHEFVIVTDDKDLLQIPGRHYHKNQPLTVEEAAGDLLFYTQTLTGDQTDGYSGCPGIGPTKAKKILECKPEKRWPGIVAAYEKAGLTEADALVQARLARILRFPDWDSKGQQPILWTPSAASSSTPTNLVTT